MSLQYTVYVRLTINAPPRTNQESVLGEKDACGVGDVHDDIASCGRGQVQQEGAACTFSCEDWGLNGDLSNKRSGDLTHQIFPTKFGDVTPKNMAD